MGAIGGATPEPDGAELRLSVAAVARRLGVAPATLRTWDRRYGLGPAGHAPGAHRRYGAADVARLEAMRQALLNGAGPAEAARYALAAQPHPGSQPHPHTQPDPDTQFAPDTQPDPDSRRPEAVELVPPQSVLDAPLVATAPVALAPGREPPPIRSIRIGSRQLRMAGAGARARGLARAAVSLDAGAIGDLLAGSLDQQGVVPTWELVVRPVLGAVADCWEDIGPAAGGAAVGIEHLLTECTLDALRDASARAPAARNRRPVLLACVPDELHSLPLHALSATLAHRAIRCRLMGAALPVEALCDAIRRTAPAAVFLWAQMDMHSASGLLECLPRIRQRFRVFVGGPGWERGALPASAEFLDSLPVAADRIVAAVGLGSRGPATATLRS